MDVRVELWGRLSAEELMLLNCGIGEDSWESLGLQRSKEISPGISLEGMMLKLKLQYFGHLMRRVHSLEKTDAGRDWGQEEKGTTEDEMAGWTWVWVNSRCWWWTGMLRAAIHGVAKSWTRLSNWTKALSINAYSIRSHAREYLIYFSMITWIISFHLSKIVK